MDSRPQSSRKPLSFRDPAVEQHFQCHYTAVRRSWNLAVIGIALVAFPLAVFQHYMAAVGSHASAAEAAEVPPIAAVVHPAVIAATLLVLLAVMILPSYPHGQTLRHVFHAGRALLTIALPSSSASPKPALWRHRTLFLHTLSAVTRCPINLYCCGALTTWLAAVVMDTADLPANCVRSIGCLFRSLQDMAATFTAAAPSHPVLQVSKVAALLSSSSSLSHLTDAILPGLLMWCLEKRARKAWMWQQQQQQVTSKVDAANDDRPEQLGTGSSSSSSGGSKGKLHSTVCAADSSSACSRNEASALAVDGLAATVGSSQNLISATAKAAAQVLYTSGLQITTAAAAPAALAAAAAVSKPALGSLQYVSPLARHMYTFKFNHPTNAGPGDYQLLQQKLVAAMQAQLDMRAAASPASPGDSTTTSSSSSSAGQVPAAAVGQCVAFKGCWQLVMDVVATKTAANAAAAAAAGTAGILLQQQGVDAAIQSVLQQMPGWNCRVWQEMQDTSNTRADTLWPSETAAAEAAAAAAGDIYLQPISLSSSFLDSKLTQEYPAAASSAAATPDTAAAVTLHMPGILVHQLLASHHKSPGLRDLRLRVVVVRQNDSLVVLDQTTNLPDLLEGAAATATAADKHQGVTLVLHVPCDSTAAAATSVQRSGASAAAPAAAVYSVVLMKEGSTYAAGTAASDAAADEAAPALGEGGLIAQLPLLLLPAAAQQELQELFMAALDQGCQPCKAYQMLLPLLQDWALLLLDARGSSSGPGGSAGGGSSAVMQLQINLACDALLSYFNSAVCLQCYKLVSITAAVPLGKADEPADCPATGAAATASHWKHSHGSSSSSSGSRDDGVSSSARCSTGSAAVQATPAVTGRTIMFRYQDDAVQKAYHTYKTTEPQQHDLVAGHLYFLGVVVAVAKAIIMYTTPPTTADTHIAEVASVLIKAVFMLLWGTPQSLSYLVARACQAQQHPQQQRCQQQSGLWGRLQGPLSFVVQWRDTLFTCFTASMVAMLQFGVHLDGCWGAAWAATL